MNYRKKLGIGFSDSSFRPIQEIPEQLVIRYPIELSPMP